MDLIIGVIQNLVDKYPVLVSVFTLVGVLRVINKPLFAFLHSIADATPTDADNKIIDEVEHSKVYTTLTFILDYLASIKISDKK